MGGCPPLKAMLLWASAAFTSRNFPLHLQEFSPFTPRIHLMFYLHTMLYL